MTFNSFLALLGAMIVLAIIPDTSAIAVVARSIASGFAHGFVTVIGILVGDFIFILFAVYGLATIAETMGVLFVIVKYLGGAYLIWLGIKIWQSEFKTVTVKGIKETSWFASFLCGLFITLSDPKAILFYISFLPAFVDLSNISIREIIMIMSAATIAVGGTKISYVYLGDKAQVIFQSSQAKKIINIMASVVIIATGIILMAKT